MLKILYKLWLKSINSLNNKKKYFNFKLINKLKWIILRFKNKYIYK